MPDRAFEVVTFDCYGTLIDWGRGIREAFADEAARAGATYDGDLVMELYHRAEPRAEAGAFRPYREVLADVALELSDRMSLAIGPDRSSLLADRLPGWPPFEDTAGALRRLSGAGFRLGILSNVDDDLLAGTLRRLPEVFDPDLVVTAQQVGSYKPAPGHFEEARRRIGERPWLHAAQSLFHDIRPAAALGIAAAWVNRQGEARPPDVPEPLIEAPSLAALADRLLSGGAA